MKNNVLQLEKLTTAVSHSKKVLIPGALALSLGACGGSSVSVNVNGTGTVRGLVDDKMVINCGSDCSHSSQLGFGITLAATPGANQSFVGWGGDADVVSLCGSEPSCTINVEGNKSYNVSASFRSGGGEPGLAQCQAYLASGVYALYAATNKDVATNALAGWFCKMDLSVGANVDAALQVSGALSAIFGESLGEAHAGAGVEVYQQRVCAADFNYDRDFEQSFELKYAADLTLLKAYQECLYDARNQVGLTCGHEFVSRGNGLFILSFMPTGESFTLEDFSVEPSLDLNGEESIEFSNTARPAEEQLPSYLTAFDDENAGDAKVFMRIKNVFESSSLILRGKNDLYGGKSCSVIIPANTAGSYTVGGTVSGLGGGTVTLDDGFGHRVIVKNNGSFQFPYKYAEGDEYKAYIVSEPTERRCTADYTKGTVGTENVTTVGIDCAPKSSGVQRITVPAVSEMQYVPPHVKGDREFYGNGPEVEVKVTLRVDGDEVKAKIFMDAEETRGDKTQAKGEYEFVIYTAESNKKINQLVGQTESSIVYIDDDRSDDKFIMGSVGPVSEFVIVGDTRGNDAGEDTKVTVRFNSFQLDIEDK